MKKDYLVIRKEGLFYSVFDSDAEILNYLFDYKIINNRCGFPINAINKVLNTLEEKKINYEIIGEDNVKANYKRQNQYSYFLSKAKNKLLVTKMIYELKDKLETLKEETLYEIITKIRDIINEY